jgi:hypothetical protein
MRLLCVVLLMAGLLLPAKAWAPPMPFTVNPSPYAQQTLSPLDTQGGYPLGEPSTWVYNPTLDDAVRCSWNDQDNITYRGGGNIDTGQTVQVPACLVADYDSLVGPIYPKQVSLKVWAPGDTLTVTLTNDAGGSWSAGPSVPQGNLRVWKLCVTDPVADAHNSDLNSYSEVSDSNGGRGQVVQYRVNITSPGRKTSSAGGMLETHGNQAAGAAAPRTLTDVPCP